MGDEETGSEWSHILGEAKAGPLKGERLTIIPSVMTNWEAWHEKYPHTSVTMIERSAREFQTDMLRLGHMFGIALVHNGQARLWPFDRLSERTLVHDRLGDLQLLVHFDRDSCTPVVWNRRVGEKQLTFVAVSDDELIVDRETGSTWEPQTGAATGGPLAGTKLDALPAIVTFQSAWKRFHPDSTIWSPE